MIEPTNSASKTVHVFYFLSQILVSDLSLYTLSVQPLPPLRLRRYMSRP